jgi:hypothetical protein
MPTDTIVLLAFVVAAFAVFASAVLWADRQTRDLPKR